jgi:hypothetical protein
MAVCRSCGTPVRWVRIEPKGRRMPIDVDPVEWGNLIFVGPDLVAAVGQPTLLDPGPTGDRYVSHFATCPDADDWRAT